MKTRTVIERIGERLGPIDWSFDFSVQGWDKGGCVNPECVARGVEYLRELGDGEGWEISLYSIWHEVLWTGMYDGWPYWRPMPTICYRTWLGAERTNPWDISEIRKTPKET